MFFAPRDAKALKCISAAGEGIIVSMNLNSVGHKYWYSNTNPEYYSRIIRIGQIPELIEYSNIRRILFEYHVQRHV